MTEKKSKKILITLSADQDAALRDCMKKDLATKVSGYIAQLIAARYAEVNKRGPGRPKKDDEPEEPEIADIPNPDKMDAPYNPMLTRSEYDARRKFAPDLFPEL